MVKTTDWILAMAVAVYMVHCCSSSPNPGNVVTVSTDSLQQTDCSWNCTSGECLPEEKLCDGRVDCEDRSDETWNVCLNRTSHCTGFVYFCDYGACVDLKAVCNGVADCADSSDERNCDTSNSTCPFKCSSGECLEYHQVCDGGADCPDKSDESLETCSTRSDCPGYAFRCDYGGCVDSGSRCNGVMDCADGSDEKLCPVQGCRDGQFQCDNGSCISGTNLCDGRRDCGDGSDENTRQCENFVCPSYAFRCDYGACIDGDEACDGHAHCADGSDESEAVCAILIPKRRPCPPLNQPRNGSVEVVGSLAQYRCEPGFLLKGPDSVPCHQGTWMAQSPMCVLDDHASPGTGSRLSSVSTSLVLVSTVALWMWT